MTTTAKKTRVDRRKKHPLALPASTEKATIGGTQYLIIPSAEFEDWYTDQMLAAIASDRLRAERKQAAPWAEVVGRLRKNKRGRAKGE